MFQGGITQYIFEQWLEHDLLPLCGRWPEPKSILVMDNCKIHHSEKVLALCEAAGVLVRFLPPYSPSLNPIEESFHDLKLYIRKMFRTRYEEYPNFQSFLIATIREFTRGRDAARRAREYFKNSGYRVEAL